MSKQDIEKRLGFAAQGVKAEFVRFMDLETWKNSKGTVFTAGIKDDAGRFQPYVTARDSSGGDQLQTRSAPTFKTEQGARKWLNTWMQNNKSTSSRPGVKAKMSATFIVAEAIFNAENAVRRGDNENARRWIKAAQDAMDETVVSTGMRSKLEQLVKRYKMSRPGVKAKFELRAQKIMGDGRVYLDLKKAKEWLSSENNKALEQIISSAKANSDKESRGGVDGPKFNYYADLAMMAQEILKSNKREGRMQASRPGVKAKFEDGGTRGAQALAFIKSKIAAGRTVAITTATRSTQITPKTYAKWEESGTPLFKLTSGGDLKMYEKGSYVFVTQGTTPLAKISSFARPGVKAKMALTISTVGAKNLCYEALANLGELTKLAAETNSGWDFHVNVMINHVKDAIARMETKPTQAATDLDKAVDTLGMLKKIEPKRLNDIQKGSFKQLIGYVAKSLRDAKANIKLVTTASRPGAKAKMAAFYPIEVVNNGSVTSTMNAEQFRAWAVKNVAGVSRSDFLGAIIEKFNQIAKEKGMETRVRLGNTLRNAKAKA